MNSCLPRILGIIILSLLTACSLPWQNRSPKTEDKTGVNSAAEMPDFPPEGKRSAPGGEVSSPSSGLAVKSEKNRPEQPDSPLDEALESFQRSQVYWRKGDFPNALIALDQSYRLILQVNPDGNPDLAQQKEKLRFLICRRMLEIYATQATSTNGSQEAVPLVLNRYVEREINLFRGPERKFFLEGLKRSGQYRPMIAAALEKAGLPKELSWLPLIESGFKAEAFSRARALGLWQFIPSTGYKFGLKRDRWVDERMDPRKSTEAAIAYLRELHAIFGDWCTVLAAYNCGEGRVLEVIRTQRVNYLDNFWDLFEKLPQETARYVPRFMATLHMIGNPGRFGLDLEGLSPPLAFESARISKQVSLKDVAKILAVSPGSIEALNPELRLKVTPPAPYDLKVPIGKGDLLLAKLPGASVSKSSPKTHPVHRVQRGETLGQLAGRYRTSVQAIVDLNRLPEKDLLRLGQELKIPLEGKPLTKEAEAEPEMITASSPEPLRYRVRKGDTLRKIVEDYQTNFDEIMRLNHLETTNLRIDQVLLIPPGNHCGPAGRTSSGICRRNEGI
jgi:membrane-bound lytic murein transglycosylase D